MTIPLWNLLIIVTTFKGYSFIFFIATATVILTIRIIKYFIQLVAGRPALTLTEKSLFDYQTGLTIDWTDIKDFKIGGYRTTYISIKLFDSEKYISIFKNPLTKFLYRLNTKWFHGTFTFNVSILKGNNDKIFETLEYYLMTAKDQPYTHEKFTT
jgi:hypothetical protein